MKSRIKKKIKNLLSRSLDGNIGSLKNELTLLRKDVNKRLSVAESQLTAIDKKVVALQKEIVGRKRLDDAMLNMTMMPLFEEMRREYLPRQLGLLETVRAIAEQELSFVRIGDGELKLALDINANLGFQKNSASLQRDLVDVISHSANKKNVIFGTPHMFRDRHWSMIWARVWPEFKELIDGASILGNAHVTRPIFFAVEGQEGVQAWREVWADKHVTVITGRTSRFDLIPQLFDNVLSSSRIDSVDRNAYADIPRILSKIRNDSQTDLFIVALGPAGTVLSSAIADMGRQAVDIGHISDSYLAEFEGGLRPEARSYSSPQE